MNGMGVGIMMSGKKNSKSIWKRMGGMFGRGVQWGRSQRRRKKDSSSDSDTTDTDTDSDEEERRAKKKLKKERKEKKKLEKKAARAKVLFEMMNGNSSSSSGSSSSNSTGNKDDISDGDRQVMKYILSTGYKMIEDVTDWNSMEETVAGLTKNQIFKLLATSGLDKNEYAKLFKRKTQTSRDDLAAAFTKQIRKSIQNSKT